MRRAQKSCQSGSACSFTTAAEVTRAGAAIIDVAGRILGEVENIRRIAQEKIAPSAEHHDRTGEFPLDNIRTLGENGLMGIEVPAEYGGAGMDPISYVLAMVEIAASFETKPEVKTSAASLRCRSASPSAIFSAKRLGFKIGTGGRIEGAVDVFSREGALDGAAKRFRNPREEEVSHDAGDLLGLLGG